jgi:lipid II isoglutaminyl synthase (glutamine-hydrolysing)
VHLYPATMNPYGDRGNVAALTRRAQWRGIDLVWHAVELGETAPPTPDLVFMGGGQDRVQGAVAEDLGGRRDWLGQSIDSGTVVFAVCAGLQLMGHSYIAADGSVLTGLGLLDLETVGGDWRLIGNVVAEVDTTLGPRMLAGFENHGGRTHLGPGARPLGRVLAGNGNNGLDRTEGVRQGTVVATYLHGPVLPKNAWLTDELLEMALRHGGDGRPLAPLDTRAEDAAQLEAMETALRDARTGGGWRGGLRAAVDRSRRVLHRA